MEKGHQKGHYRSYLKRGGSWVGVRGCRATKENAGNRFGGVKIVFVPSSIVLSRNADRDVFTFVVRGVIVRF